MCRQGTVNLGRGLAGKGGTGRWRHDIHSQVTLRRLPLSRRGHQGTVNLIGSGRDKAGEAGHTNANGTPMPLADLGRARASPGRGQSTPSFDQAHQLDLAHVDRADGRDLATLKHGFDGGDAALHLRQPQDSLRIRRKGLDMPDRLGLRHHGHSCNRDVCSCVAAVLVQLERQDWHPGARKGRSPTPPAPQHQPPTDPCTHHGPETLRLQGSKQKSCTPPDHHAAWSSIAPILDGHMRAGHIRVGTSGAWMWGVS